MSDTPGEVTHYMLRTIPPGRELDQYVFQDLRHALLWLGAPSPYVEKHYKVALAHMRYGKRQCSHCGHREAYPQIRRTMSVSAFVQQYSAQLPDAQEEDPHA